MLNQLLFGAIGFLMVGIAGTGAVVMYEEAATRAQASDMSAVADADDERKVASDTASPNRPAAPVVAAPVPAGTPLTITECVTVRVGGDSSDEDEDEREDDDRDEEGGTEERCTTREIFPAGTPAAHTQPAPLPTQEKSPAPATAPAPSAKIFTMAEVRSHASAASCWSVIGGSVYDLSSFVSRHPGGATAIKSLCGVDGTAAYNAQHAGSKRPANELTSLQIGVLAL